MKNKLTDILNLVAATMFADKRIFQSEIDVFIKSTRQSNIVRQLEPQISEAKLLAWYEMNKDHIAQKLETAHFKDWLYDILERLKDLPNKQEILKLMQDVSYADMEHHVSEEALIVLSKNYWAITTQ